MIGDEGPELGDGVELAVTERGVATAAASLASAYQRLDLVGQVAGSTTCPGSAR